MDAIATTVDHVVDLLAGSQLSTRAGDFRAMSPFVSDPSQLAWPATLPLELALKVDSPKVICEAHGIGRDEWDAIRHNPVFIADLGRAVKAMQVEGASFKARAGIQASELLKTSWKLIHDPTTPAAVRADLLKYTIKCAGLDASKDQAAAKSAGTGFSIQINLG